MAKFLKHVGKHGERKVAVIFREIPGEEHMCLVVYTELLNQNIHDPLITCIESAQGQASENLGDALNRSYTKDGQVILQMLHREGMMKKVQTSQVTMTPHPNQSVRLAELNSILNEMAKGESAVRKLADIDASRGLQDPKDVARRKREYVEDRNPTTAAGILDNVNIANNLRMQAAKMDAEAKGLMSESARLLKEAAQMEGPIAKPASVKKTKSSAKTTKQELVQAPPVAEPKKAGRPRKNTIPG